MSETLLKLSDPQADTAAVGSLNNWPLADLLVWLHQTGRTAMLRIGAGLDAGVVFFRDGFLYRCEWGHLAGEQALMALMGLEEGTFSLIQRDLPRPQPNLRTPTEPLLEHLLAAREERARARAAV